MAASKGLPEELSSFINTEKWTYAKTMPKWPHEYLVREKVDETLFDKLATFIRANGYVGRFYNKAITYYDHEGRVYWTMGAPIDETTIINRCRKEDSFESRHKRGTLPGGRPMGLPDLVPYLLALAIPSRIRSTVSPRSISARTASMWNMALQLFYSGKVSLSNLLSKESSFLQRLIIVVSSIGAPMVQYTLPS